MNEDKKVYTPAPPAHVMVSVETAEIINRVFLPSNPRKMRTAHPDTLKAVEEFRAAIAASSKSGAK